MSVNRYLENLVYSNILFYPLEKYTAKVFKFVFESHTN